MIMIYYDICESCCELRLMEEILHQLIGSQVVYPIIYKVLYIPGGCFGFLPSTVCSIISTWLCEQRTLCPASEDTNDQRLFRTDPPATLEPS